MNFWLFCAVHLLLWTVLPAMLQRTPPTDVVEGLAWGREWQLGYSKHPPLAPWLTELFGGVPHLGAWPIYLLSQLCVVTCFWAVWRLAREFVAPGRSLLAVLLLEGITFYNISAPEFNPNVLELPLWSLAILCLWLAMQRRSLWLWAALGCCGGLALLAKYYSGILLLSMGAVLVLTPEGRRHLRTPGPYLAAALALGLFLPHAIWSVQEGLSSVGYALNATRLERQWVDHFIFPARFLLDHGLILGPMLLLILPLLRRPSIRLSPFRPAGWRFEHRFLAMVGAGPLLLTLALSLAVGWKLLVMWGTPLWSLLGLFVVMALKPELSPARARGFGLALLLVMTVTSLGYADSLSRHPRFTTANPGGSFPGAEVGEALTREWRAATGRPLEFVVGSAGLAGAVAYFSPDRPSTFIGATVRNARWINPTRFRECGGILVWDLSAGPQLWRNALLRKFPTAQVQPPLRTRPQGAAEGTSTEVGWAILPPSGK